MCKGPVADSGVGVGVGVSGVWTPLLAEVLTRVMRLGLESDSSHYFCDL